MAGDTLIPWCNSTWNPVRGCTRVSPGCVHCYIEQTPPLRSIGYKLGDPIIVAKDATFNAPLAWNKKPWVCDGCGATFEHNDEDCPACTVPDPALGWRAPALHRRRVFTMSLSDWLHPDIPLLVFARMLDVIRRCQDIDFLLCTKRPELFFSRLKSVFCYCQRNPGFGQLGLMVWDWCGESPGKPPHNVWILATAENQEMADKRIPELLRIPAVVHGLSCEPLLGPIDLNELRFENDICDQCGEQVTNSCLTQTAHCSCCVEGDEVIAWPTLDWVIVGGESGKNARPCNVDWIRSIKDQCQAAGVACFVKQMGSRSVKDIQDARGHYCGFQGVDFKHPKGGDPAEWPEDLRVREFPKYERPAGRV